MSVAACDVGWGGASVTLENPAPEADSALAEPAIEIEHPLPDADLLYLVRFTGSEGRVRIVTAARLVDGVPATIGLPSVMDESYRARFDSVYYAPDLELTLHSAGRRIGSVILDGTREVPDGACVSTGGGQALLPPGLMPPAYAFAWSADGSGGVPAVREAPQADDRMRTFGPVLAENLLRRGGESRPYLAQRVDLVAVPWPGDERPAMAATYLVNDDLSSESPANAASSLFVLARFDRTRGYFPEWWEVRRYGNGVGREAFTYLEAITTSAGRVDFVARHDDANVVLAASVDQDGDRSLDWREEGACSSIELVGSGTGTPVSVGN